MKQEHLEIADRNLYEMLRKQVNHGGHGLFTHSISEEDADNVTKLEFSKVRIETLEFLKYFPRVEELSLHDIPYIRDFSGIRYLSNLKNLSIYDSIIDDISPLQECTMLEYLDYIFCDIKCSGNQTDFSFLGYLTNLYQLDLTGNNVSDISFAERLINLRDIVLCETQVTTLKPLINLPQLRYIEVEDGILSDIDGIEKLTSLEYLYLKNNKLSEETLNEIYSKFGHMEHFEA